MTAKYKLGDVIVGPFGLGVVYQVQETKKLDKSTNMPTDESQIAYLFYGQYGQHQQALSLLEENVIGKIEVIKQ